MKKKLEEDLINQSKEVSLDWEYLLEKFSEINTIKDQSEQQYELVALAKQYKISLESLEKIFILYQEKVEINKLKSAKIFPGFLLVLLARLENLLDGLHRRLRMMAIFPILEQLAKLSIVVGLAVFITECTSRGDERIAHKLRTQYEAWNIIKTHNVEDSSNGGRQEAIEYLSEKGLDLSGMNLSNAYLTRIKLNQTSTISKTFNMIFNTKRKPRFLRTNLENALVFEGDLSKVNLRFSNFKQAVLYKVKFNSSDLDRANFEEARVQGTNFKNTSLRCTNFLNVEHLKAEQVKKAKEESWKLAIYNSKFVEEKLGLQKRNMLDVDLLDDDGYKETINKYKDLKEFNRNFYCYNFHVDNIYIEKKKKNEFKKLKGRFEEFKEVVKNDFRDADFRYAYLNYLDLSKANLENANLSNAYFTETILKSSNLRGANLFKTRNLNLDEIKLSCNWDEAIYTEANWDEEQLKWIAKNGEANQKEIEKMKNDHSSDPQEPPNCNEWKK